MADRIIIRDNPDMAVPPPPPEPRAKVVYNYRVKPPPRKTWPLGVKLIVTALFVVTTISAPQDPLMDMYTWLGLFAFMFFCVFMWGNR